MDTNGKKLINNLIEDYCSFEVSKLLKEKGFRQRTLWYYFEDGEFKENSIKDTVGMDYGSEVTYSFAELLEDWNDKFLTKKNGDRCFGCSNSKGYFETFSAPTHTLAIKWIRENFGFHIVYWLNPDNPLTYYFEIDNGEKHIANLDLGIFHTPQEATEAALLYTLKNLIT